MYSMGQVSLFTVFPFAALCFLIGYLGQEGTSDEDLHQHGEDQLDNEEDDGSWAFFGDAAETVADGRLGLQGEEEGPRQGLHLHHTGCVVRRRVELWRQMLPQKLTLPTTS